MARISRSRLALGTKLVPAHVFTPLSDAATQFGGLIDRTQIQKNTAPFRLIWHFPFLRGSMILGTEAANPAGSRLVIPFTLPPLQDRFDSAGRSQDDGTRFTLEEIQVSFDQRGEPSVINAGGGAGTAGFMALGAAAQTYDLHVSLREKGQRFYGETDNVPRRDVVSFVFPNALFSGANARFNPAIVTDLNLTLQPYRTFALYLHMEDLGTITADYGLVGVTISLKLRAPLIEPATVAADGVQNMPMKHNGAIQPELIAVNAPAVGATPIRADGVNGVQTNLETVDDVVHAKLNGGYSEWSDLLPAHHHLRDDHAYEVIAVPMFTHEAVDRANATRLPYVGGLPYTGDTADRRIVPIVYPLVVEHVIACINWSDVGASTRPGNADLIHEVGVGLGAGFRADDYDYQEIAYATWNETQASRAALLIDEVKHVDDGILSNPPAGERDADFALMHIPLVYPAAGGTGVGYYTTGAPVFVGRSWFPDTSPRTNIASQVGGALGAPATAGREQWIEVRWRFGNNVGGLNSHPASDTFVGHGGFWVYLVCRKPLVQPHYAAGAV